MKFVAVLIVTLGMSVQFPAWAKDGGLEQHQSELCEGMLGLTLKSGAPDLEFDLINGIGARGFLGSYPEANIDNMAQAATQGAKFWGHSIGVQKNIMAAANHDIKNKELSKISYLISEVDVSDLTDDTEPTIIQERFNKIFASAQLIYFDEVNGKQTVREIPREAARRLIHPRSIIWYSKDDRGPRFHQLGWVFPKTRGVLTYRNVFESNSETIKKRMREARALEKKGYTFTFNQDFQQALDKARDQVRIEKVPGTDKLKAVPDGSRYRGKEEYNMALEGYRKGVNVSVEVRDPSGRMVAGIIGHRYGNVWAWETVFYDYMARDGSRYLSATELAAMADAREAKSLIDLAKMAALVALLRLHDHGIDVADAGMVTPFTAGLKGVYITAEEFLQIVDELKSRPQVNVDVKTPFSFLNRSE